MDYTIDFTGCIEPPKDVSVYKNFRISIDGFYYWGDGYRTAKNKQDFDRMIDALESNLDSVIAERYVNKLLFKRGGNFDCDEIVSSKAQYEPSNVYLHPMEFTGILKEPDIERLCNFVNSFTKTIDRNDVSASISYINDTYHMNDIDYINLIVSNSSAIIKKVQEFVDKLPPDKKERYLQFGVRDVGFDFAKTCRLSRDFSHSSGYSSSDADVKTVENLVKNAIQNGYIK